MIANYPELIEMKDAGNIYNALKERIFEHIMHCHICRPNVRCTQYMSMAHVRDDLAEVCMGGKNYHDQAN